MWSYNLPYAVAMSTIGGEQNILKAGTQQGPTTPPHTSLSTQKPALYFILSVPLTWRTEPFLCGVCLCDGAAVLQIEKALTDTFVPAVREAAIVQCINEGLTIVQQTVAAVGDRGHN